jgi:outer membrane protein assembly factor BamB
MSNPSSKLRYIGIKVNSQANRAVRFCTAIAAALMLGNYYITVESSQNFLETQEFSTYRGSNSRLGSYAEEAILVAPSLISQFIIEKPSRTTPVLSKKYTFIGDEDGSMYALDDNLLIKDSTPNKSTWQFQANGPIVSTSVLFNDKLYFGSLDDNVYLLDPDTGLQIAVFGTFADVYSSPLLVNNVLYIGSLDHQLYALNADDLSKIWQTDLLDQVWSSPAWGDNGKIYVGSRSGNIFALDAETGSIIWQHETGGWMDATPAVYDDKVFVGSHDGIFYALDAEDGSVIWQHDTGQLIYSSAAVGVNYPPTTPTTTDEATPDATAEVDTESTATSVYVNNYDGEVFAFDIDTGDVLWQTSIGGPAYSSPVYVNGILYVITEKGGLLYALDAQFGSPRWTYVTGRQGDFRSASPVPYDGKLYVASNSEGLLVLGNPDDE